MARLAECSLEVKKTLTELQSLFKGDPLKLFNAKTKSAAKPRLRWNLDVKLIKRRKDLLEQFRKKNLLSVINCTFWCDIWLILCATVNVVLFPFGTILRKLYVVFQRVKQKCQKRRRCGGRGRRRGYDRTSSLSVPASTWIRSSFISSTP
jgi:hypothetical protein